MKDQRVYLDNILDWLGSGVHISMSATGQPTENGLVERLIRTLEEEHLDTQTIETSTTPASSLSTGWRWST